MLAHVYLMAVMGLMFLKLLGASLQLQTHILSVSCVPLKKLIVGCEVQEFIGRHTYDLNLSGNVVFCGFMTPMCT